jgi:uncharacterized protein (TIGR01777 family)
MKRVGVTGASGFLGRAVVAALAARGDSIRAMVRSPQHPAFPAGVEVRTLDPCTAAIGDISAAVSGLDAVIHLSGETVAGRWTQQKKRLIRDSREMSTRNLVTGMWESTQRPGVLVCASASGYYGSRADEVLTETSPPGGDFLAHVCIDWEREAQVAAEFDTRVVSLRFGLVLGPGGGALAAMLPAFRFGAGGALGSGRQWWPWIHKDDAIELILFALDREDLFGPLNAVAPDPATNARFAQALGYALRRPSLVPAPALALELVLGEFAQSLLASQLVLPAVATGLGFRWRHPDLERALLDLLDPGGGRAPGTHSFAVSERFELDPASVFAFFSDPGNLEALTPPYNRLQVLTPRPIEMQRGTVIEYRLAVHGMPIHWKTLITDWDPPRRFADIALRGPYLLWRHRHSFEPDGRGVRVNDEIEYALGVAPLSDIVLPMVRGDLRKIFEYRSQQAKNLLARSSAALGRL